MYLKTFFLVTVTNKLMCNRVQGFFFFSQGNAMLYVATGNLIGADSMCKHKISTWRFKVEL